MAAATALEPLLAEGRYTADPAASAVRFAVSHLGVQTVRGTLGGLEAAFEVRDGRIAGTGSVAAASISTRTPPRDLHLRSYLLAARRHPRLELHVDAVLAAEVPATLVVRGRPLATRLRLCADGGRLHAFLRLDRRAAVLGWPGPLDRAVGRYVDVEVDAALTPRP
jgi:hypothetical protein